MNGTQHPLNFWLVCGLMLSTAGCGARGGPGGGGAVVGSTSATATQDESGIKHYAPNKLPAVDYNIPPQDGGRLEVPTPPGWQAGSRQSGTIIWFYEKDRAGLPRIVITGEPCKREGVTSISQANVMDFAKSVAAELAEKESEIQEEPRALMLGNNAWVRYVVLGKYQASSASKAIPVDRQILRTVVDGREYVVELQVNHKQVMEHRDSAYAIAAGIKFHHAGTTAPSPATSADSPPPETTPATPAEPNKAGDPAK